MPSRQDQLHSYQFMVQRVVGALVMRETDPAQSPFRRAAGATLASLLIAAITLGGVIVYGAFVGGGGKTWKDEKVVIVEKESGARYVYRNERLHLVLNYASALLIVDGEAPKTIQVSRKSLEGTPRGVPWGIVNAPDSLPAADRLSRSPWTICSRLVGSGEQRAPRSVLMVGTEVAGGQPLAEDAVLARHPDGSLYLIWHNKRHQIRDPELVLPVLAGGPQQQVPFAPAALSALSAGPDLARIPISGRGDASDRVSNRRIGDVVVVKRQGGGEQYAVVRRDGLANITALQANLILSDSSEQKEPTSISQADFASLPKLDRDPITAEGAELPAVPPKLAIPEDGKVCSVVADDSGVEEVRIGSTVPDGTDGVATAARSPQGGVLADHVMVTPGRGVVVEAAASPGAPGGTVAVITDLGRQYTMATPAALRALGYGKVKPVRMPASLVALVPRGPALDPQVAAAPVSQE